MKLDVSPPDRARAESGDLRAAYARGKFFRSSADGIENMSHGLGLVYGKRLCAALGDLRKSVPIVAFPFKDRFSLGVRR
jgi:hypothetical protein